MIVWRILNAININIYLYIINLRNNNYTYNIYIYEIWNQVQCLIMMQKTQPLQ